MAADKIFWTHVGAELLFVISGTLLIVFGLKTEATVATTFNADDVARDLLLQECPAKAAVGNGVLIFITFLISVPAMVIPTSRGWLKFHGYMVTICALFTLVIGLDIWLDTLKSRQNLLVVWNAQPATIQSQLQKSFNCCGYMNSTSPPFIPDSTCPNAQVAASMVGCVKPFTTYGNNFLDLVFTGAFGIVGVDVLLILTTAILLKDRKEKERYRTIDEKNGTGSF